MDYRLWFEILRFYFRVALWGDPYEPTPLAKAKQRSEAAPVAQLKPLVQPK